ncbi:MAG: hypothetical protein RBT49_01590 [Bacteroidales bacterium]|nr:hypothetical protein [Bacteroidales bacterium]
MKQQLNYNDGFFFIVQSISEVLIDDSKTEAQTNSVVEYLSRYSILF